MLRFVRNVVPPMCPSIPAVTDIVQNANIPSKRNGLKLRCPNFYQWVTFTPFLQSLKNLTSLFYRIRDFFILS